MDQHRTQRGPHASARALGALLLCALPIASLNAPLRAQTHKVAAAENVVRAGGVYEWTGEMAKAAGIKQHQSVGLSSIGGARIIQHWDVAEEKNKAKAALRAVRRAVVGRIGKPEDAAAVMIGPEDLEAELEEARRQ